MVVVNVSPDLAQFLYEEMTSSTFVAIPPFSHREDSYQNKRMHNVGKASRPVERSAGKGTYMDRLFQATHQTREWRLAYPIQMQ